jgi:hypothetical protein
MKTTLLSNAGTVANRISCVKISHKTRELHALSKHENAGSLANLTGTTIAKGSYMKTIIRIFLATIFVLAASLHVHAQGIIDQESATGPVQILGNGNADGLNIQEDDPLLQSFTPTLSAIGYVSLEFADIPNNGNNGATVDVNLYADSPDIGVATLLGTTAEVYIPNGFNNSNLGIAGIATFDFSTPIALTAGDTYYIEPVVVSGDNPWDIIGIDNSSYNGQLFEDGYALNGGQFWFQEGIEAVPEPTTLALIGFGGLLVFILKRRSNLPVFMFAGALFTFPVLSVNASQDSVVQVTASAAGLASVPDSELPHTGTFYIATLNSNSIITLPPYPMLPTNMMDLPAFYVTNDIYILDDTKGQLSSSSERMSSDAATAAVQEQSQSIANLIEMAETPPVPNGGPEGNTNNPTYYPNDLPPISDTTNMWLLATNDAPDIGFQLENAVSSENYQLLYTSNLLSPTWNLGEIIGTSSRIPNFDPVPYTNATMFFRVHQAYPILVLSSPANALEMNPTNTSNPGHSGYFYLYMAGNTLSSNLMVYFNISGTAQDGVDYSNIPDSFVFPAGTGKAYIYVNPFTNGLVPNQTVIITLMQKTNYLISPANYSATNTIVANPQVYPIVNGDTEFPCPETSQTFNVSIFDSDPRGLPLTYSIATWPSHGTLDTNNLANNGIVTYTGTNCYEGQDSFTYAASDGQFSSIATVTLTITNTVYANAVSNQTCRGTPVSVTLSGGDYSCGIATNYSIVTNPSYGSLTGTPPNLTYTPTGTNFTGTDTFIFQIYDNCGDFATNIVSVTIGDNNLNPNPLNLVTGTNQQLGITLTASASDSCIADNNYYSYTILTEPTNGTLTNLSGAILPTCQTVISRVRIRLSTLSTTGFGQPVLQLPPRLTLQRGLFCSKTAIHSVLQSCWLGCWTLMNNR